MFSTSSDFTLQKKFQCRKQENFTEFDLINMECAALAQPCVSPKTCSKNIKEKISKFYYISCLALYTSAFKFLNLIRFKTSVLIFLGHLIFSHSLLYTNFLFRFENFCSLL